jgi:hypothetical protein
MSDWKRSTKKLDVIDIQIDRQRAFYKHINSNNLGNPLGKTIMCVETVSEKKSGSGMGDSVITCDVVLTPVWIMWVTRGDKSDLAAFSAKLENVKITDYAQNPQAATNPDAGLEITGIFTGKEGESTAFIGLGDEPEAKAFKEMVFQTIQNLNK